MMSPPKFFFVFFFLVLFVFSFSTPAASSHSHPESPAWDTFVNLTGLRHGDAHPVLPDLKKYLHHFGYLSSNSYSSSSSNFTTDATFGDDLEAALKAYQHYFNLNVTGVLDIATVTQLMTPRCGVPDMVNGTLTSMSSMSSGGRRQLYAYFNGRPKWPADERRLTYSIIPTPSEVSIDPSVLSAVFASAFSRWAAVTSFTFEEVSPIFESDSDISIGFFSGAHGDGQPFDGPRKVLAHAFLPTNGRFHLDAAEDWVAQGDVTQASSARAIDLESVSVHEIGHLLGMWHSPVKDAVMYPTLAVKTRKVDLNADDVQKIQNLYQPGNN